VNKGTGIFEGGPDAQRHARCNAPTHRSYQITHTPRSHSTCGSNPMSNIRSASSITRYVTRRILIIRPAPVTRRSISRPGVAATTSAPRLSSEIWLATPLPPKTATAVMPIGRARRLTSWGGGVRVGGVGWWVDFQVVGGVVGFEVGGWF